MFLNIIFPAVFPYYPSIYFKTNRRAKRSFRKISFSKRRPLGDYFSRRLLSVCRTFLLHPSESRSSISPSVKAFVLTSSSLRGAKKAMRMGKSTPIGLPFTHLYHINDNDSSNNSGNANGNDRGSVNRNDRGNVNGNDRVNNSGRGRTNVTGNDSGNAIDYDRGNANGDDRGNTNGSDRGSVNGNDKGNVNGNDRGNNIGKGRGNNSDKGRITSPVTTAVTQSVTMEVIQNGNDCSNVKF